MLMCYKGQLISKAFFLNSIAQKTKEILDKFLPYEARAEFCQIFCSFFGQCFWDLLTFSCCPERKKRLMKCPLSLVAKLVSM